LNEIGFTIGALTLSPTLQPIASRSPSPPSRMNLRSARYYSAKDVRAGALNNNSDTDKGGISTESNDDSEPGFDDSDGDDFDPILMGDYDAADDNIDIN
jgi:hypothetical protein